MNSSTILIILAVGVGLYLVSLYNFFQTALTRIKASIQEIGNQLKRQADLIPNLEASVKGYLKHEKDILTMLSDARKMINQAVKTHDVARQTQAAGMLGDLLPRLSVIVESNPELKGNTTVMTLMEELRDTADKVMYSRRTLIDLGRLHCQSDDFRKHVGRGYVWLHSTSWSQSRRHGRGNVSYGCRNQVP
jgi:LemA protein